MLCHITISLVCFIVGKVCWTDWSQYDGNKWWIVNNQSYLEFLHIIILSQAVLTEKDSEIAEIEAASTGEAARLRASLEEVKGELALLKDKHVCFSNLCYYIPLLHKSWASLVINAKFKLADISLQKKGRNMNSSTSNAEFHISCDDF